MVTPGTKRGYSVDYVLRVSNFIYLMFIVYMADTSWFDCLVTQYLKPIILEIPEVSPDQFWPFWAIIGHFTCGNSHIMIDDAAVETQVGRNSSALLSCSV